MNIETIRIKNFKRLTEVEISLADITYLVGGNNSGKSSVLQAIHMAIGCGQRAAESQQQVIAESSLRYCPTANFLQLGNSGKYENRQGGSRAVVEFAGKTADGADASYKIEIYKARNYHNVGVDRSGISPGFGQQICDPTKLFSVYVPGLAGIAHNEEMLGYASVFNRAAGGDANLVFRNIIRLIADRGRLGELEMLLADIIGPCKFKVDYDDHADRYVKVEVSLSDPHIEESFVPIDLSGTGVLQITQILAYVILFEPRLLLVDEPDSHLHPSRQALLSATFSRIVTDYRCKVIVTTHSRHLVSTAPAGTRIVWLRNGQVEQESSDLAAVLLDLGALDQIDSTGAEILIFTEDQKKRTLEDAVASLGMQNSVKVISYKGVSNAATAHVVREMSEMFARKPKIIMHRDRDFLVDAEIDKWSEPHVNNGLAVFCPRLNDIESYLVTAEHLAQIYGAEEPRVHDLLNAIYAANDVNFRAKFVEKRRDANRIFWPDGGSPVTEDLWPAGDPISDSTLLGKLVLPRVNEDFGVAFDGRKNVNSIPCKALAAELAEFIGTILPVD